MQAEKQELTPQAVTKGSVSVSKQTGQPRSATRTGSKASSPRGQSDAVWGSSEALGPATKGSPSWLLPAPVRTPLPACAIASQV